MAQKDFVEGLEPSPQIREIVAFSDLVDFRLDGLGRAARRQLPQNRGEVGQGRPLVFIGGAVAFPWLDEILVVGDGAFGEAVEHRRRGRCRLGDIAADETPQNVLVLGVAGARQIEQDGVAQGLARGRRLAAVNMPDGVVAARLNSLLGKFFQPRRVVVDTTGDDVEEEAFGFTRPLEHELRQAFRGAVAEPFLDCQAVALRFRDLVAVFVEEEFVVKADRRCAAQDSANPAGQFQRVDEVLSGHLVIDAERGPAHRPIGLPAQFAMTAGDRNLDLGAVLVAKAHAAALGVDFAQRYLQDASAGRADRENGAEGCPPLGTHGGQHEFHDRVVVLKDGAQDAVENAGPVQFRGALEFVVEAEAVEETAEAGVVVVTEAFVLAEGVGHLCQRFSQVGAQLLGVGDVVRHRAQGVHVVGEGEQLGRDLGQGREGVADHGGAGDLGESADVGQAGRPVTGLEQDVLRGSAPDMVEKFPGFDKWPGRHAIAPPRAGCSPPARGESGLAQVNTRGGGTSVGAILKGHGFAQAPAEAKGGHATGQAGGVVGFGVNPAYRRRSHRRRYFSGRHLADESHHRRPLLEADDRIVIAAHAGVALVGGAAGENLGVPGRNVGVSADDQRNSAIDEVGQGHLFARRLAVDVDHRGGDRAAQAMLGQLGFEAREGVVESIHEQAGHDVEDQYLASVRRGVDSDPAPRRAGGVIVRPQQPTVVGNVGDDFALRPDVVASREDVDSGGVELMTNLFGHAVPPGRVFDVGDDEVEAQALA